MNGASDQLRADLRGAAIGAVVAEYDTGAIMREQLKAYAQASGDSNPLHLDPAFAQKAGFDDVIVHGMLGMALLGRLLTGPLKSYRLQTFDARFGAVVPVDQSLRCRALLDGREDDGRTFTLRLEALGANGKPAITGTARLAAGGP